MYMCLGWRCLYYLCMCERVCERACVRVDHIHTLYAVPPALALTAALALTDMLTSCK